MSAPSGAGKTTLCRALRQSYPDICYSISHTTRPPRPGESNGVDYYFTTEAEFLMMRDQGQWAEWAQVHGHYYGTSMKILDQALSQGRDILLLTNPASHHGGRNSRRGKRKCQNFFIGVFA